MPDSYELHLRQIKRAKMEEQKTKPSDQSVVRRPVSWGDELESQLQLKYAEYVEAFKINRNPMDAGLGQGIMTALIKMEDLRTSQKYKTRCGYPVRIYATDGGTTGDRIQGAAFTQSLGWQMHTWLPDGRAWASDPIHEWDLVEQ